MEATDEIKTIVGDLLQRYKDEIKNSGHSASGDLEKTARYKLQFSGRYFEVIFQLQDYWKYLENGTRPHFPPIDAIERWIQVKRIVPRTVTDKVPTTRQLAFLISREISVNGTKPTKLLQKTIDGADDLISLMLDEFANQMQEQINEEIENTVKQ
jgi:hypothetical protein